MGAPKGNQFWKLRSKHGVDKLFKTPELMLEAASEYFNWVDENPFTEEIAFHHQGKITKTTVSKKRPYTIMALCSYLGCNSQYFSQFEAKLAGKEDKESKDFALIVSHIRETIYNQKFEGAAAGFFNSNIIARELGLSDKSEQKIEETSQVTVFELPNDNRNDK